MADMETGFRALREAQVPDVWEEVERRASERRRPLVPWARLVAAVVALAVAAAGVVVAIEVFGRHPPPTPRSAGTIPGTFPTAPPTCGRDRRSWRGVGVEARSPTAVA
jgi:hypothetical protein